MDFLLDSNDYSDDDDLEVAELPESYLEEELYFSKLNSVNQFKTHIDKEPDFYGIRQISDVELLNFIENRDDTSKKVKTRLTSYQYELFTDIHIALFGIEGSKQIYEKIASKIFQRCYI
jgi:hypothetical protein